MHGSMGDKIVNAHYVALQLELATTLSSNIFSLLCGRLPAKFLSFDSRIATQHLFYDCLRASLCKILISSFAHKMDFAHNFSVDFF